MNVGRQPTRGRRFDKRKKSMYVCLENAKVLILLPLYTVLVVWIINRSAILGQPFLSSHPKVIKVSICARLRSQPPNIPILGL